MLTITIICIGKVKEKSFQLAIDEYSKRLSKYCNLHIIELPDEKLPTKLSSSLIEKVKEKECTKISAHIPKDSYVFSLDLKGINYTSEGFSKKIESIALRDCSHITFIIGGTLGLTDPIYQKSNELISFSSMTFPHQLMRIFLLEQLFRAFKIAKGETYHW